MEKFRKVRAGWYTLKVVGFEESMEKKIPEQYVDVSNRKKYGDWVVSVRNDFALNTDRGYVTDFADAKTAKKYAVHYAEFLKGKRLRPKAFEYV